MRARLVILFLLSLAGVAGWRMFSHWSGDFLPPPTPAPAARLAVPTHGTMPVEIPSSRPETESERLVRLKQYGDISREKIARVDAIVKDYAEQLKELISPGPPGTIKPGDIVTLRKAMGTLPKAMALLNQERHADLAKILTPQEVEDLELRWSSSGLRMLGSLADIPVSNDELRMLIQLQASFDRDHENTSGMGGAVLDAREKARYTTDRQMRAILGDERFLAYLVRDDPIYKRFLGMTDELAQPSAVATRLWEAKGEYFIHHGELAAQFRSDYQHRDESMAALGSEVVAQINALVGDAAIRNHPDAFNWLPH